jgi:hypothetical protein
MIRNGLLTLFTFVSVILFPWPLSVLLTVVTSFFEPLVPIAVGIFADTLYWAPHASTLPIFTLYGLVLSAVAVLVRSRLSAGIIGK